MSKGRDFVSKIAQQATLNYYTQQNPQIVNPTDNWFFGTVSADKSTVTDGYGNVYSLAYTGEPFGVVRAYKTSANTAFCKGEPYKNTFFVGGGNPSRLLYGNNLCPADDFISQNMTTLSQDPSELIAYLTSQNITSLPFNKLPTIYFYDFAQDDYFFLDSKSEPILQVTSGVTPAYFLQNIQLTADRTEVGHQLDLPGPTSFSETSSTFIPGQELDCPTYLSFNQYYSAALLDNGTLIVFRVECNNPSRNIGTVLSSPQGDLATLISDFPTTVFAPDQEYTINWSIFTGVHGIKTTIVGGTNTIGYTMRTDGNYIIKTSDFLNPLPLNTFIPISESGDANEIIPGLFGHGGILGTFQQTTTSEYSGTILTEKRISISPIIVQSGNEVIISIAGTYYCSSYAGVTSDTVGNITCFSFDPFPPPNGTTTIYFIQEYEFSSVDWSYVVETGLYTIPWINRDITKFGNPELQLFIPQNQTDPAYLASLDVISPTVRNVSTNIVDISELTLEFYSSGLGCYLPQGSGPTTAISTFTPTKFLAQIISPYSFNGSPLNDGTFTILLNDSGNYDILINYSVLHYSSQPFDSDTYTGNTYIVLLNGTQIFSLFRDSTLNDYFSVSDKSGIYVIDNYTNDPLLEYYPLQAALESTDSTSPQAIQTYAFNVQFSLLPRRKRILGFLLIDASSNGENPNSTSPFFNLIGTIPTKVYKIVIVPDSENPGRFTITRTALNNLGGVKYAGINNWLNYTKNGLTHYDYLLDGILG